MGHSRLVLPPASSLGQRPMNRSVCVCECMCMYVCVGGEGVGRGDTLIRARRGQIIHPYHPKLWPVS